MTLAVARRQGDSVIVEADTWNEVPPIKSYHTTNSIPGILKVFVINRDFCFAFSGEKTVAFDALREIVETRNCTLKDIQSVLLTSNVSTNGENEYLICDSNGKMSKVCHGHIIGQGASFLFVGNTKAASLLDGGRVDFQKAIDSDGRDNQSVDGLALAASLQGSGFNYISRGRYFFKIANDLRTVTKLDHNSDNLEYSTFVARDRSFPVLGVHIPEALVGYVYDHVKSDEPTTYTGTTAACFSARLRDLYGCTFVAVTNGRIGKPS